MEKIMLNNGVEMPVLGFGTYQVTDPAECEKSVAEAIRAGYRLIDTAQAYGNEEAVGAGIKSCGVPREELFITTKVWFRSYETEDCRASLEESMRKLGVDYLDMVLLHWPFGNVYAAWRVLEEYNEAGKIRAIGVSNMEADRLIDLITFNKVKPALNQIKTHLYCQRQAEHQWLEKFGVAHQAYAPLGQGRANEMFGEDAVKTIAAAHGKTPAQILLRFQIQNGVAVIPKSVHVERIQENNPQLEREYGVNRSTISGWVKQLSPFRVSEEETVTLKEYKALQKENQRLKTENEILKKATAIFAKEQ